MTVEENLAIGAFNVRARKERKDTLAYVCNLFPVLKERHRQLAFTLSGGEQQMLTIGRALMAKPRVLILDEPTAGLAPVMVERVCEVIRDVKKNGITILIAEQQIHPEFEMCDQAVVMHGGRIVKKGNPRDVFERRSLDETYFGSGNTPAR